MISPPRKRVCHRERQRQQYSGSRPREAMCSRVARQHHRAPGEHRMRGIDRARARDDRDLGRGWQVKSRAELGVGIRSRWIDLLCAPRAARRRPQHASPDEHGVGDRAQQTHEEAVGVVVAGDHARSSWAATESRRPRRASRRSSRRRTILREARDRRRRSAQRRRQRDDGQAACLFGEDVEGLHAAIVVAASGAAAVRGDAGATRRGASARRARGRRPPPRPSPSARAG